mmetsp:Transcript_30300/g.67047  ORF Transcript_30300/g.67047 Transcript_30300/m.67047 type:complete len:218 (-) Transcript_30300:709-1362(-)
MGSIVRRSRIFSVITSTASRTGDAHTVPSEPLPMRSGTFEYCTLAAIFSMACCFFSSTSGVMERRMERKLSPCSCTLILGMNTDTSDISFSVKYHKYCLRLAFANNTGIHPETRLSNNDFRVMESPGGAGQNCVLWKSIIWLVALTTPLHAWAVICHWQLASVVHWEYSVRRKALEFVFHVLTEPIKRAKMSRREVDSGVTSQGSVFIPSHQWKEEG